MGWIIKIIVIIVICIVVLGLYIGLKDQGIARQFCEDHGYDFNREANCYRVEDNKYISRGVRVIDKKAYWEIKDG